MAKKGRGLPSKYAKMGFKRGWAALRASKRRISGGRKKTSLATRSRPRATFRGYYRRVRGIGMPSMSSLVVAAPHVLSNLGLGGLGYSVPDAIRAGDGVEAMKRLFVNELMLFSGYDAIGGSWNWKAPMINYGSLIVKKIASKYFRGTKIGPIRIA
jgi:hypothetical protein